MKSRGKKKLNKKKEKEYENGYAEWEKKNKLAEDILGVKRWELLPKVGRYATEKERKKLYDGNRIDYEEGLIEVGKRLRKEGKI